MYGRRNLSDLIYENINYQQVLGEFEFADISESIQKEKA
jgi:hypothetical protein